MQGSEKCYEVKVFNDFFARFPHSVLFFSRFDNSVGNRNSAKSRREWETTVKHQRIVENIENMLKKKREMRTELKTYVDVHLGRSSDSLCFDFFLIKLRHIKRF